MKKVLLSAISFALLTATACKKDDNTSTTANQFTIGSNTYTATSVLDNMSGFTVVDVNKGNGSMAFAFTGGTPKQDGEYTIVEGGGSANKVSVVAAEPASMKTYIVTSGTVSVKFNDGKVSIKMPNAAGKDVNANTAVQISADIHQ
ncbi:MAG: hypothetical protein EOP52_02515 [Sphingobacteriales bacterium]|nr:MAG: hypothetical protein EOP52_02515 [Sphingobacteriales bacterium]